MYPQITRRGAFEFRSIDGQTFKRRAGQEDAPWLEVKPEAPPEQEPSSILAVMAVAQSEGEPDHWCMFFGPEDGAGIIFQVTGDAISMYYQHESNVNIQSSDSFQWAGLIASDVTATSPVIQRLEYWIDAIAPPSAPTQAQVTENCQNWVLKVLAALVTEGLIPQSKLQSITTRKQPLYPRDHK